MRAALTTRDDELLQALTHRVRVLSLDQIASEWWGGKREGAAARLRLLTNEGLLESFRFPVHEPPELRAPLAAWRPNELAPDAARLAYSLEARWSAPPRAKLLITASRRAGAMLGGAGGRRPRGSEVSHDLALSQLYLNLRRTAPLRAETWCSEAELSGRGFGSRGFLPDAAVTDGGVEVLIELAGSYRKGKLVKLHRFCEERGAAYEIW